MRIITILGLGFKTPLANRAHYRFDNNLSAMYSLKKQQYTNMLPLLIDNFGENIIIPIFTQDAKTKQAEVLNDEFGDTYENLFLDECFIQDEKDFYGLLKRLNHQLSQDEEFIIDLTHGFRHIPILATISLITQNIEDTSKIKHIFFAKEIEVRKEYEIIDLKEYLELANMSYILETFIDNYTISSKATFSKQVFQDLSDELRITSNHILSNSLKYFFETDHLDKLLENIDVILKHKEIATFQGSLEAIKKHIHDLKNLKNETEFRRFYELAKLLNDRGYLLNAITLLFESIGHYCADRLKKCSPAIEKHIQFYEDSMNIEDYKFTTYKLTHESRNFVKNLEKPTGGFLYNPEIIHLSKGQIDKLKKQKSVPKNEQDVIHSIIDDYLNSIPNINTFCDFIKDVEALRNNLAHGNSSKQIDNAKQELKRLLTEYDTFCIQQDILIQIKN